MLPLVKISIVTHQIRKRRGSWRSFGLMLFVTGRSLCSWKHLDLVEQISHISSHLLVLLGTEISNACVRLSIRSIREASGSSESRSSDLPSSTIVPSKLFCERVSIIFSETRLALIPVITYLVRKH